MQNINHVTLSLVQELQPSNTNIPRAARLSMQDIYLTDCVKYDCQYKK